MFRTLTIVIIATLVLVAAKPPRLSAANRAGDANNDGAINLDDAALIQSALYGTITAPNISPLALVGADTTLSLDDLLLVGQVVGFVRTGLQPKPGLLTISPPVAASYPSGSPPQLLVYAVASAWSGATLVDGIDSLLFAPLFGYESVLTNAGLAVAGGIATIELNPLNTGPADDVFSVDLLVTLHDSEGSAVNSIYAQAQVTVTPAACGDGVLQPGETCDDGDTNPCTGLCDGSCTGPGFPPTCGDGILQCGETCDDGNTAPCIGDCNNTCSGPSIDMCGDGIVNCGEACDVPRPRNPSLVGHFVTSGDALEVVISGNRAYVVMGYGGFQVLDISTPTPTPVGFYISTLALGVAVSGDYAYIADGDAGLLVLDITAPNPTFAAVYDTPGYAQGVTVSGSRAYVANQDDGLFVFDISSPMPALLGVYNTPGSAWDVFIRHDRAYVADGISGLQVLDISTPTPTFVGAYDTPGHAIGVFVSGDNAYLADGLGGLQIIDITTPAPTFVAQYPVSNEASEVFVSGQRAYIAGFMGGFEVVDISSMPPTFVGIYNTPVYAMNAFIVDGLAYLADHSNGLYVLDIYETCTDNCTINPCIPGSIVCGDGIAECGETCDDGNTLDGDGCNGNCTGP